MISGPHKRGAITLQLSSTLSAGLAADVHRVLFYFTCSFRILIVFVINAVSPLWFDLSNGADPNIYWLELSYMTEKIETLPHNKHISQI